MAQPVKYPPRTIHLGGEIVQVGDVAAGAAITPGMLVERYDAGAGVPAYKPHSGAGLACSSYALNQSMLNKGVDDLYAIGDLVEVGIGSPGATFWALIPSGQTIAQGTALSSNGDGRLKAVSGVIVAIALETIANTGGLTPRIRVESV